jgi:AraC-like DNA-binding protein
MISTTGEQPPGRYPLIIPVGPREVTRTFDFMDITGLFPALANFVEGIADWDISDVEIARGLSVTALPSTTPYIIVQYRTPIASSQKFGCTTLPHGAYRHVATSVQSGIVTVCPRAPFGVIIVRLKPEGAAYLLGDEIYEFADAKIDLGSVFSPSGLSSLAEMLAESRSSHDRIVAVLRFLLANIRPHKPDPVVCRAAAILRSNPSLRLGLLAAKLGVSERHLSRKFKTVFGTGPKRFARVARLEQVLRACSSEAGWADIAYSCGFVDQAHMINEFSAILGATPNRLIPPLLARRYRDGVAA